MSDPKPEDLKAQNQDLQTQLADLSKQLDLEKAQAAKLAEQAAREKTDSEQLQQLNDKLHEENETFRKQAQEAGNMSALLVDKAQRLESQVVELGRQRDQFKDGFEKYGRKIAELSLRLEAQKAVTPRETKVIDRA